MFNLYEIVRSAQGGQGLDNLASQFSLTPEEADRAVRAIVPELSEGFLRQASEPAALGFFAKSLGADHHRAAFAGPVAAQAGAQQGGGSLEQIFGSRDALEAAVARSSSATGIGQETLSQMLPVIVSMIFGGLAKSMENQGFGGILEELSKAPGQGNLGSIFPQNPSGGPGTASPPPQTSAPQTPSGGAGAWGGLLGAVLEGLKRLTGAPPAAGPAAPSTPAPAPSVDAAIVAGLEALKKMLQPGTPSPAPRPEAAPAPTSQTQASAAERPKTGINAELDRILGKNSG
jgi:hypothetical protein